MATRTGLPVADAADPPDVIVLRNVSKRFRIALDRSSTLKYRLTHPRSASRYRDLLALDDVSFSIPRGQFAGVIGHNGSGKSTLLKVLSGIYRPTAGAVDIRERVSPFLELGVGFNPELTARENIYLNGAILGLTRAELDKRVEGIIDFAGAEVRGQAGQKLKNFSSGMQVRLAFSVAIQADAGILLMDEVLAVGDAEFQERCFDVFARYKREGRTVILVTHDTGAVDTYCDRAILMEHGRVVADGNVHEVTSRYRRLVGEAHEQFAQVDRDFNNEGLLIDAAGNVQGSRWGSHEVEITDVVMRDPEGEPRTVFAFTAAMEVAMTVLVHRQVEDIVCGIAVHHNDGLYLTGSNSLIGGIVIPCPATGQHVTVRFSVPRLPLQAGSYLLSATAYDQHFSHPYDVFHQAFPFRVIQDGAAHGLVDFGGSWSIDNAARSNTTRELQPLTVVET